MKKTYSVSIKAFATVVVVAGAGEDPVEIACEQIRMGDLQLDEGGPAKELKTKEEIERAKRHAEVVLEGLE